MLRITSIIALFALFHFFNVQQVNAIRAYPHPIEVTQPDGSLLTIRLQGDEFYHFQTTEDGYLLKENSKGFLTYAIVTASGAIIESSNIARNINQRSANDIQLLSSIKKENIIQAFQSGRQKSKMLNNDIQPRKAYPLVGSPKSLVILANFQDKKFVTALPETAFQNLLTQPGYSANGATGSAKDYFLSSSYGKFAPDFIATDTVTLPQNLAYYGVNSGGTRGNDTYPLQMIIDACTAANNKGVDFSQYDTDNDGVIDNVFVYFAGYNEAEGGPANTIWPHRWGIYPGYNYTGTIDAITFDNKIIMDYACTSELKGSSGSNMCGIGIFCHEFGHVIGLPDYYDTSGTKANTLDNWSIMDYGAYLNRGRTPPLYSAYDRFYLGWLTPEQVSTPSDLTLLPLYQGTTQPANTNQQAFLFSATNHNLNGSNPNPKEFFIVEYRKHTGWDTYLGQYWNGSNYVIPSDGMLIWHIDYDQSTWDINKPNNYTGSGTTQTLSSHMRVYLHPTDGSLTTPPISAFTIGSFTPTTWSGTDINRAITSINKTANQVTFEFMGGAPVDPNAPGVKTGTIGSNLHFAGAKVNSSKIKTFNIKTTDLTGNLSLLITGTNAAYFTVSSATITKEAANAIGGTLITITYLPTAAGTHTATLTISGGGLNPAKVIDLTASGY